MLGTWRKNEDEAKDALPYTVDIRVLNFSIACGGGMRKWDFMMSPGRLCVSESSNLICAHGSCGATGRTLRSPGTALSDSHRAAGTSRPAGHAR